MSYIIPTYHHNNYILDYTKQKERRKKQQGASSQRDCIDLWWPRGDTGRAAKPALIDARMLVTSSVCLTSIKLNARQVSEAIDFLDKSEQSGASAVSGWDTNDPCALWRKVWDRSRNTSKFVEFVHVPKAAGHFVEAWLMSAYHGPLAPSSGARSCTRICADPYHREKGLRCIVRREENDVSEPVCTSTSDHPPN